MNSPTYDTPCIMIDLDKVERNIRHMQQIADDHGIGLRPHAKTHKMPEVARMQMAAGAIGVTVAKLGEAEVLAKAGISDILIAYPVIGGDKIKRLAALLTMTHITVAVESIEGVEAVAEAGRLAEVPVDVLIEIDSGFGRVGLNPGEDVIRLAGVIASHPWLRLKGLLTFAGQSYDVPDPEAIRLTAEREVGTSVRMAEQLREAGYPVTVVSVGSTPSSSYAAAIPGATELRPGTYVFGDLMQVKLGAHELERCALTVRATVISRPAPDRAVIDAGTKVFSSDGEDSPLGTGRGYVPGRPGITLEWLTEEHGMLKLAPEEQGLAIGDILDFIPVHCCAVVNLTDQVAVTRNGQFESFWNVSARGKVR
ncbi:MAG: hypothetical protein K0Q94_3536 [Paenibacillus sp.]|jgi:D-serine deaminase-like pyridoxal phosphate-dependent protein|nr:hypothetical protein [Paenibacillus sp.]